MHLIEGSNVDDIQGGYISGKYAPFDIKNEHDVNIIRSPKDGSGATGGSEASILTSNGNISTVDVLKTLFFVLVWYTFSTFLTLYNKTLLGDDLGKFPAPLLMMNIVHFTMQAVLSKLITWYWSHRFLPPNPMTWRDYFYKVFYLHDEFTWLKGAGLLTIMVGVSLFNWYKYEKLQKGRLEEDETATADAANQAAKYVILGHMMRLESFKDHMMSIKMNPDRHVDNCWW